MTRKSELSNGIVRRQSDIKNDARTALIVVGMHRSGTSALTRVLNLLGCDVPSDLIDPLPDENPLGFWESRAICDLNDSLLRSASSHWRDWLPLNLDNIFVPETKQFQKRARVILDQELGDSNLFVLKDPRFCRVLPFWLNVFEGANIAPRFVLPIRNPLEVGASLKERNGFTLEHSFLIWMRYLLDAEHFSRGQPRVFVGYEQLLSHWSQTIEHISNKLGVHWTENSHKTRLEIDNFLSEEYRNHSSFPEEVIDNPMLSDWLRQTFVIFREWTVNGENTADFPILDRIRGDLDNAASAFGQLVNEGLGAYEDAQQLRYDLAEANENLLQLKKNVEWSQNREVKTIEGLKELVELLLKEVSDHQSMITKRSEENDSLSAMITRLSEENGSLSVRITKLSEEIDGLSVKRLQGKEELERIIEEIEFFMVVATNFVNQNTSWKEWFLGMMPISWRRKMLLKQLKWEGLFNKEKYLADNPDVSESKIDPLFHYLKYGFKEGRKRQGGKFGSVDMEGTQ